MRLRKEKQLVKRYPKIRKKNYLPSLIIKEVMRYVDLSLLWLKNSANTREIPDNKGTNTPSLINNLEYYTVILDACVHRMSLQFADTRMLMNL
jgi:hypothetical protein